ncbi:hypothetical protein DER46DRAFT_298404 [Fusarium sp. MPI-SDFR-AT-0072]|nr:hypothetical protein DER46DRAFT_298404 [Fusarium sp. MPI-SDFR-AT-0072]
MHVAGRIWSLAGYAWTLQSNWTAVGSAFASLCLYQAKDASIKSHVSSIYHSMISRGRSIILPLTLHNSPVSLTLINIYAKSDRQGQLDSTFELNHDATPTAGTCRAESV